MKLREFLTVFEQSDRLRIVKNEKDVYTGFLALMAHAGGVEELMDAEVKRFRPIPEIRHNGELRRAVNESLEETAAAAAESLRRGGPYRERTGKYTKDWTHDQRSSRTSVITGLNGYSVYNKKLILSILVDTFISKISFPMQPGPEIGSISDA